jgi:putative transposase
MKVSRSAYYQWLNKPEECNRDKEDQELLILIRQIFAEGRSTYGARRIKKKLSLQGKVCSRHRIVRLMKEANLVCKTKRKFKATTDSKHNKPVAPNLLARGFNVVAPNRYYVGDITYIATEEGWLYLATVIDLFSRKVVGWSMSDRLKAKLVNDALLMAIWQRKPDKGLIWHTDQGSQYASDSHRKIIKEHHIIQSMSKKGSVP